MYIKTLYCTTEAIFSKNYISVVVPAGPTVEGPVRVAQSLARAWDAQLGTHEGRPVSTLRVVPHSRRADSEATLEIWKYSVMLRVVIMQLTVSHTW